MSDIETIQQKLCSSGIREGLLLNKRRKTLKTLLEKFEERLDLLPSGDRDVLRSMYYQSLIDGTLSHYLCAEKMIATKAIWASQSPEDEDRIERELRERIIPMGALCSECD